MYQIIFLPLVAALITQLIKIFLDSNKLKWNLKNLVAYSGMPSGHSAIVVSLATIIGLTEGLESSLFALAFVFAIIVIRDALGIRKYLGEHGRILNKLVKDLKDDEMLDSKYPHLLEKIGHTPAQIIVGSLIGFIVSIVGYIILK
ncbi:MAG: hypothetical protein UT64_C0068G0005 [Candidatus Falkowbacteria bacterium GW2011_GWF2_39_8]|uniref:Acid phosphatase/vanadium-dependent haloperoxidase related protein n=1 Tax=Candidatus Falkowbacteria bacterium GW2011_GWF2_39_8 TaxID=1618642 RepID=A0A0G0T093_9BACT|nr:MAG: hypothetical protein UT64_C0068G0005 [Candidatus Falkowbacteria bacterium GW2011_GWF2_39_8]